MTKETFIVALRRHLFIHIVVALILTLVGILPAAADAASPAPAWLVELNTMPTNLAPGDSASVNGVGNGPMYEVRATNVGAASTTGPSTFTDTFPEGVTPVNFLGGLTAPTCEIVGQTITCTLSAPINPGETLAETIGVDVDPLLSDGSTLTDHVTVSGGGAPPAQASTTTTITSAQAPFGFLPGAAGLGASLTEVDGSPATRAGSHPYQLTVDLGFAAKRGNHLAGSGTIISSGGGVRDARTYLPHGLVVDPAATPVRCTEAQLEANSCPDASVVGIASIWTAVGVPLVEPGPLYNMVPPPGAAASLAFNPVGQGIFVHILGGVRAGDYALSAASDDVASFFGNPFFGIQVQLWGDPSSPSHDSTRGACGATDTEDICPVPQQHTPFITAPTSCSPSMSFEAEVDSWGDPGSFLPDSALFTDLAGIPTGVSGCNAPDFSPTLKAQPTTSLTDSPSGLDVDLHIPQSEGLEGSAEAHLRKAVVTLPGGLVVNPSSANGLAGCSSAQIGIDPRTGVANGDHPTCPNASKIGSVEVDSPLLAQYDTENKVQRDPEGNVIPEPLPGSVYVATPYDNPFHSLLAIYVAIDDPQTGLIIKLAGHVEPNPQTGRLTTTFDNNPQLPFSDFRLDFFDGATAALRTPVICGVHTITSDMTPWSAPEGADAHPSDSFQTTAAPGGACPTSESAAPNAPTFDAGTISPQAGSYSPFVLHLRREDGSQELKGIDTTLPPGLTGKLAGIPYCSEGALAAAAAKSGNQEKAAPSCPAASEVGTVDVAAGAGPAPYNTAGIAYLAGPYKGAPLSLAIVTPATAGPYDLGTVVVRTALYVNPETARIHAVSDPIPQILQGIPLDVRSIALKMSRPNFTLNPTSCEPMAISGVATSTLGQLAPLSSPFQVGGCSGLAFKPKLAIHLEGGTKRGKHPALRATLTYPPGASASIARAAVTLPHSEFLDQGHIRTVCTRVTFAEGAVPGERCPPGSVYGHARAITPLLDAPLQGPVYLRSSNHQLPDLVAALNGQIQIVLDGTIDSVRGGIRNRFEVVPDAPVSKFVLTMQGAKKGLLQNSTNLCASTNRAVVKLDAQNGKAHDTEPVVSNSCKGKHKKAR